MTGDRRFAVALMVFSAMGLQARPAAAQSWFFELSRHTFDIDGDFDDSFLLTGPDFVINVPALQQVHGLGFALGLDMGGGLMSLTHVRADPQARSVLGDATASLRSWGIDFSIAPGLSDGGLKLSPLFRLGGAFTFVRVPDSASDGVAVAEGGYNGLQFNLGVGAILRVTRYAHVSADFSRRFLNFGVATAFDDSLPIDDGLSGSTNAFTVSIGIHPG